MPKNPKLNDQSPANAILKFMASPKYQPQNMRGLLSTLPYDGPALRKALGKLVESKEIIVGKRNRYFLPASLGWKKGRIQGTSRNYAFFIPEDGSEDIFISNRSLNGAWHGDLVWVKPQLNQGHDQTENHRRGRVTSVIERVNTFVLGEFENRGKGGIVYPLDKKIKGFIRVTQGLKQKAKNGDKVMVEISVFPADYDSPAQGIIREIVAKSGAKKEDTLVVMKKYGYDKDFDPNLITAAEKAAQTTIEQGSREDWRKQLTITIDGSDAKDLDDALSLSLTPEGNWLLGVHIADVAHYVKANSLLDKEARQRGTSVYFPDLVLPMLPPALSNGICSLNPNQDRLTLSCIMEIAKKGRILKSRLSETIIQVDHRLNYGDVNSALEDKDKAIQRKLAPVMPLLRQLNSLAKALKRQRQTKGSIDFNFPECKVIIDGEGKIANVEKRYSRSGEKLIEECMIAANQGVATIFALMEKPFIYRLHQACRDGEILEINELLRPLGLYLKNKDGKVSPKDMQKLLDQVKDKPEERLISTILLRSMDHAFYGTEPVGHFALALDYYSHFTSPIRRYPDLAIHRQIKAWLNKKDKALDLDILHDISLTSSSRERMAEKAEREVTAILCCRYLEDKIGQSFFGQISGITSYGMYVELDNGIEGLVKVANMDDDYYEYFEREFALKGKKGKIFRLGNEITVTLVHVDPLMAQIDFILGDPQLPAGIEE